MKNFSFRQFQRSSDQESKGSEGDPKDKDSVAYRKRREQVRKAQRTHRERKESYIKALENEVLQRRTNEAKILQEQRNLNAEVARLKRILDRSGVPYDASQGHVQLPPSLDLSSAPSSASLSSVGILTSPFHQQQLHVCSPQTSGGSQFFFSESSSEASPPAGSGKAKQKHSFFRSRGRSEASDADSSSAADIAASSTNAPGKHIRDLDQTNLGMEFVLTLEAPCLHHTQNAPGESHTPTGHALTASAPLLFQSPTQPVNTSTTKFPPWETPNIGLEKLLSLSFNFELDDGEVTPVQAWQQIRAHPEFGALEVKNLRWLVEELGKGAKCHGFGAVIETEALGQLLRNIFPSGGRDFSFGFE
ncbi:hypothetical protein K505DRAFT_266757 [Melanomma pulvis-pyrius CBS 109.77]|uniref:BZIP domain-containing protein n=1 Tax=Melanomma pulvis-pyrius CBS 109.77 TaxID=1314802 RepID=A0A6A6XR73_9PLEO|nr:hypothetical protein K505DRAFT_266757 [Melanomma pulvis-pyrius CBS 109.77]